MKWAFMYNRKDNYRLRNAVPWATYQLIEKLASNRKKTELKNQNLVMILGCGRSGTSALKEVLAGHTSIMPLPFEANHLWHPKLYPWRANGNGTPPIWADPFGFTSKSLELSTESDRIFLHNCITGFANLHASKTILLKSAMLAFMIPEVLRLFPTIKLIHLHRDGRSVALSLAKKQLKEAKANEQLYRERGHWMEYEELLVRMSHLWVEHIQEIQRQDDALGLETGGRMIQVSYETLCQNPRDEAMRIADFVGLDKNGFDSERFGEVKLSSAKLDGQVSDSEKKKMMEILTPTLTKLGYEV